MTEPVYQVRSIDVWGNKRIIHTYEKEADAKSAIATMRRRSVARYDYVALPKTVAKAAEKK
jgi:hypothetical protein